MIKIGIFGATGFVGRHLCTAAVNAGYEVHAICRSADQLYSFEEGVTCHLFENMLNVNYSSSLFDKFDCMFHLADVSDRNLNAHGASLKITKQIVQSLAKASSTHLVYLSSVYASLHESGASNFYGQSKIQVENWLKSQEGLNVLILRVPPVYGAGSKGGIQFLSRLIARGMPIPFKAASEERDYLYVSNLTDLFLSIGALEVTSWNLLDARYYSVSDGHPITTSQLVKEIANQLGKSPKLFKCPKKLLDKVGVITGKSAQIDAAFNGLYVGNDAMLMNISDWEPKSVIPESLAYLTEELN